MIYSKMLSKIGVALSFCVLFLIAFLPVASKNISKDELQAEAEVTKAESSNDIPLAIDNSEQPKVLIQVASSKEITGQEYERITGEKAVSASYISCPSIQVENTTNEAVKAFALGLINKQSNTLNILRIKNHPLKPLENFVVEPVEWAFARKNSDKKFVHEGGVSREKSKLVDWRSEEMWFPGTASDFYIFVGEVESPDGTRWFTKR